MGRFLPTDEHISDAINRLELIYVGKGKDKKGTIINFICPKHENKGVQSAQWSHFYKASYGCRFCSGKDRTTDEFKEMIDMTKINLLTEYIGFEKPITCKCKACEHIWTTTPKCLTQGKYYCPICAPSLRDNGNLTNEEFLRRIHKLNPTVIPLEEYTSLKVPILCKCAKCDNEWHATPDHLIHGDVTKCPRCFSSKPEEKLGNILRDLGLFIKPQGMLAGCKNEISLRFDYLIYSDEELTNLVFACEYDGECHYMPIDYAGKGKEWAEESLAITKKRDEIKNIYCKEHNIPLIRIPYTEKENMEDYLINKMNEINLAMAY